MTADIDTQTTHADNTEKSLVSDPLSANAQ